MSDNEDSGQSQTVTVKMRNPGVGHNISPLSLEGNVSRNWEDCVINFKIYLRASGLEEENDARKVALLLHYIGSDARTVFKSFEIDMDTCSYKDVLKFEKHCKPKKNLTVERHNFLTRVQKDGESVEDFLTAPKAALLTQDPILSFLVTNQP